MAIRITCPACEASYPVDDSLRGKKIRCKKCEEVIVVKATSSGSGRDEESRTRPDSRIAPKSVPKAPVRRPRDDDDDETPVRKPARDRDDDEAPVRKPVRNRDDDDEAPVRKPARARDDDEETPERRPPSRLRASRDDDEASRRKPLRDRDDDDRSIRKKKPAKEGMSPGLLIGIGGGALLFLGLLVGGLVFAFMPSDTSKPPAIAANQPMGNPNPVGGGPQNLPPQQEQPKTLPVALGATDLQRVKRSTVYLRVEVPSGGVSQGTGFFAMQPGIIMTNAHVIGMLTPDSLPPKSVSVTVYSGEPNEFKVKGIVLGVDRTNDLAVLRTDSTSSPLPPPLQVDSAAMLMETQPVWVFGFPLGSRLGKAMTVSASSVTALRKDPAGVINQLQVKGSMAPGNSGGPVTDSRGVVVGVSVAIIQGTEISFAIPGDFVIQVVAGGVSDHEFGTPYAGLGGQPQLPVRMTTLDPLARIREVKVDVWTGPAGATLPATFKEPQPKPGDGARQRVSATARNGGFAADLPLPPLPAGQVYWAQPVVVDAAGVSRWAAARTIPFDAKLVIDRRPALLQFKPPTGPIERTLFLKSNKTIKVFGLDEPLSRSSKMEGHVLEASAPAKTEAGTRSHLYLYRPRFTREADGEVLFAPPTIGETISHYSAAYLVAPNNSVTKFIRPRFDAVNPENLREAVGDLFDTVCNTYEVTTIPLPNRTVRPQETWTARVPMLVTTGTAQKQVRMIGRRRVEHTIPAKKEVRDLNLTCTYEGTRTVDGIHQGYILLTGVVNGQGTKAKEVYGKVNGYALVNLDSGMLAQVKTTISLEMDADNPGIRIMMTNDSSIERVEGNTQNIRIPPPVVVKKDPPGPGPAADNRNVPAGWKAYRAKNGAFAVWLPDTPGAIKEGTPTLQPKKGSPLKLNYTMVTVEVQGGPSYLASSIDVTPFNAIGGKTTADRIDWLRDLFRERARGKVSGEVAISQGRAQGKEFTIAGARSVTRYRVYMSGVTRYFMVSVTGTKEQVESKDATTFLDSYKLPVAYTGIRPKKG